MKYRSISLNGNEYSHYSLVKYKNEYKEYLVDLKKMNKELAESVENYPKIYVGFLAVCRDELNHCLRGDCFYDPRGADGQAHEDELREDRGSARCSGSHRGAEEFLPALSQCRSERGSGGRVSDQGLQRKPDAGVCGLQAGRDADLFHCRGWQDYHSYRQEQGVQWH